MGRKVTIDVTESGRKGGLARAAKLSAKELTAGASTAAQARWEQYYKDHPEKLRPAKNARPARRASLADRRRRPPRSARLMPRREKAEGEMQNLTSEAYFVLSKMLTGAILVGAISDYERPFRLGLPGAEAWEDVSHRVVKELLDSKRIKVAEDHGDGQEEYWPA